MVQSYYFPLHSKGGIQLFLFAVASIAIGFLIGWAEGVIFFIIYFFSGIGIDRLTKEQEPEENYLDRGTHTDREGLVRPDGNSANIFYCPKCGEQQDTEDQFSPRHFC